MIRRDGEITETADKSNGRTRRHFQRMRRADQVRLIGYRPEGRLVSFGYRSVVIASDSPNAIAEGGSADYHIEYDLDTLRERSQQFDRDNSLYRSITNAALDCILGPGFVLQAQTRRRTVNERLERLWANWFGAISVDGTPTIARPEVRGLFDGWELSRMALRHVFVDGDVGTILDDESGQVQLIEADRIVDPYRSVANRIKNGVELSNVGEPVAFWVGDYGEHGGYIETSNAKRIDAERFAFMASRERYGQTRGTPPQQTNFAVFDRISDVLDAEAIAWQLNSKLAFMVNRSDAAALAEETSEAEESALDELVTNRYQHYPDGMIFHGAPGESVEAIERKIPGQHFGESLRAYMRLLGLPLGLPLEIILLDWSQTNYSSARASIKQAERNFAAYQKRLKRWLSRIYSWKVAQWARAGLVASRGDVFAHEFFAPSYPFVDPQKEGQADVLRIDHKLSSRRRIAAEKQLDWPELTDEIVEDEARLILAAIEKAAEISALTGEAVSWRDLLRFAPPKPQAQAVRKKESK